MPFQPVFTAGTQFEKGSSSGMDLKAGSTHCKLLLKNYNSFKNDKHRKISSVPLNQNLRKRFI
jgi:hypothetical protein